MEEAFTTLTSACKLLEQHKILLKTLCTFCIYYW